MRTLPAVLVPLLLLGCDRDPVAPDTQPAARLSATCVLVACNAEPAAPPTAEHVNLSTIAASQSPSPGSGGKVVIPFDFSFPVNCGSQVITESVVGWVQIRTFDQAANRNVELDVFHSTVTFTNAAGRAFKWQDVGPDHYYLVGDELFLAITGPSTASGSIQRDRIVIGHVVVNLNTGETVLVAGKDAGKLADLACAALE